MLIIEYSWDEMVGANESRKFLPPPYFLIRRGDDGDTGITGVDEY